MENTLPLPTSTLTARRTLNPCAAPEWLSTCKALARAVRSAFGAEIYASDPIREWRGISHLALLRHRLIDIGITIADGEVHLWAAARDDREFRRSASWQPLFAEADTWLTHFAPTFVGIATSLGFTLSHAEQLPLAA